MRSNKKLPAESKRQEISKRKEREFFSKVESIIYENWPHRSKLEADPGCFKKHSEAIEFYIHKLSPNKSLLTEGMELFSNIVASFNASHDIQLEIPDCPIQIKRLKPTRNFFWHIRASELCEFVEALEDYLSKTDIAKELSKNQLKTLLLISLVINGATSNKEELLAISKKLDTSDKLFFMKLGETSYHYVTINYYNDKIQNFRSSEDSKNNYQCPVFFDPMSLALYRKYCRQKSEQNNLCKKYEANLFKHLKSFVRTVGFNFKHISTLKHFCIAGVAYWESRKNVRIPNQLTEVAQHVVNNAELPTIYLNQLSNKHTIPIEPVSFADFERFPKFKSIKSKKERIKHFEPINREIKAAIKSEHIDGSKTGRSRALLRLKSLNTSSWPFFSQALVEWYKERLITKRNRSVSSIETYHSQLFALFSKIEVENDFELFDSEDYLGLYQNWLEQINSSTTRKNTAHTILYFHQFCERNYDIPCLPASSLGLHFNQPTAVNAGYINFNLYMSLLNELNRVTEIDANSLAGIKLIAILAYRCGLRISDLLSIELKDLEQSEDLNLLIRTNRRSIVKTKAGRRRLHLASLLSNEELSLFKQWLSLRNRTAKSENELLFCKHGFGTIKYSAQTISSLISHLLRALSGISSFVFHHLRHTNISNMFLLASQEWELASELTGLNVEHLKRVYSHNLGNPECHVECYSTLSYFAGHSSPEPTFQSYIHFSKIVTRLKLSRSKQSFPRAFAKNVYSVPEKQLAKIKKLHDEHKTVPAQFLDKYINSKFKPSLKTLKASTRKVIECENSVLFYPANLSLRQALTHHDAYRCLKLAEQGYSSENISFKFGIPVERIKNWKNQATHLSKLSTRQGHARLIAKHRLESNPYTITPAPLDHTNDKLLADKFFKRLRDLYNQTPDLLLVEVEYFLGHSIWTRSGISFNSITRLEQFVKVLSPAIPAKHWLLQAPDKDSIEIASVKLPKIDIALDKSRKNIRSKGSFYLNLKASPKRYSPNDSKESSSCLRYVMYMIFVMTGAR